jgi:hypothetical protein
MRRPWLSIRWWIALVGLLALLPVGSARAAAEREAVCLALDRSGSLQDTDPQRYGPSVINVVADLATNAMLTVFTFAGQGREGVRLLGTFDLANPRELEALRQRVAELDRTPPEGYTPTADLLAAIYDHLAGRGAPPGAGCIVISDGLPEPDTEAQFRRIETLLPQYAARGWRLHAVALGAGQWTERFHSIATQLGGAALTANTPAELLSVVLHAFAAYRRDPPPQVVPMIIGANGQAVVPIEVDPTVQRLLVVVTRPSEAFTARLLTPRQEELRADDPRLVTRPHTGDRHYVGYALADTKPLGAGRWTVEVQGPRGGEVVVAYSLRSSLKLELVEPKLGLIAADRPARLCARLHDADRTDRPLPPLGATVRATVTDAGGRQIPLSLLDDGRPDSSGDEAGGDNVFCNRLTLPAGSYRVHAEATTMGNGQAAVTGSIQATVLPAFVLLAPSTPTVRDGETVALRVARLTDGAGGVPPRDVLRGLSLVVRAPNGGTHQTAIELSALGDDFVLTLPFTGAVRDAGPGAQGDPLAVRYTYRLRAEYVVRGQTVVDDVAIAADQTLLVRPWGPPCNLAPAAIRPLCQGARDALVAIWPVAQLVGTVLLAIAGLLLVLFWLALRWVNSDAPGKRGPARSRPRPGASGARGQPSRARLGRR